MDDEQARLSDELRQRIRELADIEQRMRSVVDHVVDGIITIDEHGRIASFNPAAERIFGYQAAETLGRNVKMLMPEPFQGEHDDYIRNYLETARAKIIGIGREVLGLRKDGRTFPMDLGVSEFRLNGHRYFTGIVRDISERKAVEEERRRAVEELARSNVDLEQFAYVASHDLQEPLRAVSGCVQILQRRYQDRLDPFAQELIGHTVDGVRRMQTLIDDLLNYSRVRTQGSAFVPTESRAVVEVALANLEAAIAEAEAVITQDDLPTVLADAAQLQQVFRNLIGNAVKFRSGQRCEIHIGAVRQGRMWVFSVLDNGIGIAPEYFERIFVIFQRLHTRTEYPGTGMGLAICKKIVERHGGRIWVESAPGAGTTFFFTIPEAGVTS